MDVTDVAVEAAVEARGLSKIVQDATGSLTILDDINLVIAPRETVAIVGASGSGKSTLLGLLAGLDVPTRGTVRLFGEDLFARDEDGRAALRAQRLGFVFQSFQLLPHLNALENVLLPLELSGRVPEGNSPVEAARDLLARAFVLHPPLLLADEPTGSLDARTGEAVIDLMFELNRERGSTLVMVTHDPDIARRCGRQVELSAGRIVSPAVASTTLA
jgi:putative ABC transport system ATP-binding protein